MEVRDRAERRFQMTCASPVVAEHAPVLEPSDRMLDPRTTTSVLPPPMITHDAIPSKLRCDELENTSVSAVGQHTSMPLTKPPRLTLDSG